MNKTETLARIDTSILAHRNAHASLNKEIFDILRQREELDLKINYLNGLKELSRRELARFHKQKYRAVTGRN